MRPFITLTRRRLIQQASTGLAVGVVGRRGSSAFAQRSRRAALHAAVRDAGQAVVDPGAVQALAMQALDAAKSAGATYADVRLTRTLRLEMGVSAEGPGVSNGPSGTGDFTNTSDTEQLGLGVRALMNGYWGFVATPYWTAEQAAWIGRAATAQAKENAHGPARSIDWSRVPVVTGSWHTPIQMDPFRLSLEERADMLWSLAGTARRMIPDSTRSGFHIRVGTPSCVCARQEQALATSEGSYVTQTCYRSQGRFSLETGNGSRIYATGLEETGRGWELFAEGAILDQIPSIVETLERSGLPMRPVEVGRKPVVCDAATMAQLVDVTWGRATEVDRALGYEANASGTSYLGPDPLAFLGTPVANELITVTANRSFPTGLATVQWDAEGVVPEDFTLVQAGMLVNYQTTREQAGWLAPYYQHANTPVRSHGCAAAEDALGFTMQRTPNLALTPAATDRSLDDLVAGMADGIVIERGHVETDFQCKNGTITGTNEGGIYQVKGGKRVAALSNAGILFSATELWKSITGVGGAASVQHVPCSEDKGEPRQQTRHTVSAPSAVFKDLAIIDITRKA